MVEGICGLMGILAAALIYCFTNNYMVLYFLYAQFFLEKWGSRPAPPPQDVSEHIDPLKYFSLNSFRNKLTP